MRRSSFGSVMAMLMMIAVAFLVSASFASASAAYSFPLPGVFCPVNTTVGDTDGLFFTVWQPGFFEIGYLAGQCNLVGVVAPGGAMNEDGIVKLNLTTMQSACQGKFDGLAATFDPATGSLNLTTTTGAPWLLSNRFASCRPHTMQTGDYCGTYNRSRYVFTVDQNFGYTFNLMDLDDASKNCRASGSYWMRPSTTGSTKKGFSAASVVASAASSGEALVSQELDFTIFSECDEDFFALLKGEYATPAAFASQPLTLSVQLPSGVVVGLQATSQECFPGTPSSVNPTGSDAAMYCSADGVAVMHIGNLDHLQGTAMSSYQLSIFDSAVSGSAAPYAARGGFALIQDETTTSSSTSSITRMVATNNQDGAFPVRLRNASYDASSDAFTMSLVQPGNAASSSSWRGTLTRCARSTATMGRFAGENSAARVRLHWNTHGYNTYTAFVELLDTAVFGAMPECTITGHYAVPPSAPSAAVFLSVYATTCYPGFAVFDAALVNGGAAMSASMIVNGPGSEVLSIELHPTP